MLTWITGLILARVVPHACSSVPSISVWTWSALGSSWSISAFNTWIVQKSCQFISARKKKSSWSLTRIAWLVPAIVLFNAEFPITAVTCRTGTAFGSLRGVVTCNPWLQNNTTFQYMSTCLLANCCHYSYLGSKVDLCRWKIVYMFAHHRKIRQGIAHILDLQLYPCILHPGSKERTDTNTDERIFYHRRYTREDTVRNVDHLRRPGIILLQYLTQISTVILKLSEPFN